MMKNPNLASNEYIAAETIHFGETPPGLRRELTPEEVQKLQNASEQAYMAVNNLMTELEHARKVTGTRISTADQDNALFEALRASTAILICLSHKSPATVSDFTRSQAARTVATLEGTEDGTTVEEL